MAGDLSLDILAVIGVDGWRLWNLHQHTRGHWEARLYNVHVRERGEGSGFLSDIGDGATPAEAIRAALGRELEADELAAVPRAVRSRFEACVARLLERMEAEDQ